MVSSWGKNIKLICEVSDLVGVKQVSWDNGGNQQMILFISYEKGDANYYLERGSSYMMELDQQVRYFEDQIAIEKFKRFKSPGIYQVPEELNKTGGKTLRSGINKIIFCTGNKAELSDQCKLSSNADFNRLHIKNIFRNHL